jgi:DNA-binding GntR family transcriptional regulator
MRERPPGANAGNEDMTSEPIQLTFRAATLIRGMVFDGILLPGEKVRQVELAERIGVSRSPLREALRTLESEGLLSYEMNRGYIVARLEAGDIAEVYRMRALLEHELMRSISRPGRDVLDTLEKHNETMMTAIGQADIAEIMRANRDFHFTIFELSPMKQFRREIARLWQLSEGYRHWWWHIPDAAARIDREHRQIIRTLRRFDLDRLIELCDAHRVGGHEGYRLGRTATDAAGTRP